MAGLRLSGDAAPTGGWTAFNSTNMTTGASVVTGQPSNPTPTTALANLQVPPTRISPAQVTQDQVLFSDPAKIAGQVLFDLATRYSTNDITKNINDAAGSQVISKRATFWRLNAAIEYQAENTSRTASEVKADLSAARKAVGIRVHRPYGTGLQTVATRNAPEHTGETTQGDSNAESEEEVAASPAPVPAPPEPSAQLPTRMSSSGSVVNTQPFNQTAPAAAATSIQATTIAPILVANVQPTNTIAAQDLIAFANPNRLTGDTLLNIATRYSTDYVVKQVSGVAGKAVMARSTISSRLSRAIRDYAARAELPTDQVKADLTASRRAAGVWVTKANVSQATTSQAANEGHTGNTTEDESDDAETQDVAATPPAFAPALAAPTAAINPAATDQQLFANPDRLFGNTLLTLAERFSNPEISMRIGTKAGTDKSILSQRGVANRINAALKTRTVGTTATLDQLKDTLRANRAANGVKTRAPVGPRNNTVEPALQAVVATALTAPVPTLAGAVQEAMDAEMVDVTTETPVVAVPEAIDTEMANATTKTPAVAVKVGMESMEVEMTNAVNENAQRGHTAAEMDAADALLMVFQTLPRASPQDQEVLNAAAILMELHKDDDVATEDEVSDTEMNDAERAEFVVDYQARWRDSNGMR
jgi:hypothetical protein